jgi:DNA-binding transcriptional ArsR family regulator
MPEKGKLPEWERMDNRTTIFTTIMDESLTFTELLNKTNLSRATLSSHLSDLQDDELIEKALENGRVVYQITFNEEKIETEFKKIGYDLLFDIIDSENPKLGIMLRVLMKLLVKITINVKHSSLHGKSFYVTDEFLNDVVNSVIAEYSKEELGVLKDPRILVALSEAILEQVGFDNIIKEGVK